MTKWQRQEDWIGSQVEDSYVMINLDHGAYIALNQTAAEAWELLAEPRDEAELVAALLAKFRVDPDHCRTAVRALIEDLRGKELILAVG